MPGTRFTKMNKKKVAKPSTSRTSSQQRTLFQTWGSKNSNGPSSSSTKISETDGNADQFQPSPDCNDIAMDTEDEDELLMQALEQTTNLNREIGTTSFAIQENAVEVDLSLIPDLPGFDKSSGLKWIYPTNYPVRDYQFDIVRSALFENTLVALPTGLGKTLIAAVVMFNFYRWYPLGKIVFMAPTKPLVTQQIEACYNIMGIPQLDIAEMTGKMFPVARQKAWKEKRVIFLTPQVLMNDLSRGTCQAEKIKCLVVDEAHKALGNYAYCQVIRELVKISREFRILALSATPGTNLKMVQEVISNLLISKIELRTDDSPNIKMYSFERKVEKIVVPLGEELKNVETQYLELLESIVNRLVNQRVCYKRNVKTLSKFLILKCRDEFRQNPPSHLQPAQMGSIEGDFALAMSLYHGYELLQLHGLRSFYQYLLSLINGDKGYGRTRSELMKNMNFMNVHDYLNNKFGEKPSITFTQQTSQEKSEQYIIGHPKLEKLQEIVLEHFRKYQKEDGSSDTRVMIFSQYRNSVSDITEMLKRQQPLVKVISFMGQAVKKETKGFTQKEQLKVMKSFREGNFNTLVSTCVGEEGLDIGDVDLIICFDASKSPIRLVQRMGRTGRKRDGRIVMLVTEGKEDQIYKQSQYNKNSINKALLNGTKSLHYYQQSPRMLPEGLEPQCHKMYICVKKEFETLDQARSKKKEEKKEEKKAKNAKGKTKTKAKTKTPKITDLLNGENSMNGRLSPMSNSNSPLPNTEFQPIDEDLDLISRLNMGDNTNSCSPSNYTRLSDDELPDVSSPRKISCSKKALCDTNSKAKSNSKTTKKKSAQKENFKRKKNSKKKEESLIDRFIIVPDNDSASDFMEEPEPFLNGNGAIQSSFKSQEINSGQERQNSPKLDNYQESPKLDMSENNPVKNCLVPAAPSLENIPQLLDDLESQRHPPDLSHLLVKWEEEFNDSIKVGGISSNSERVRIDANNQTDSSVTLAPSSVTDNDNGKEFLQLSSEREGIAVNPKDGPGSPDLDLPNITFRSPQQNRHSLSPASSNLNNLSLRKRKLSPQVVDSLKSRKHQRLKSPEGESNKRVLFSPHDNNGRTKTPKSKSPTESIKDNSKSCTSYGDLFADFSLSLDDAEEISSPLLEKTDRNSSLLDKTDRNSSLQEKTDRNSSLLDKTDRNSSLQEKTDRNSSLLDKTDDRLPEPKKSSLENSVFLDSSYSFLEKADDRLPEPKKSSLENSVFLDSSCSFLEKADDRLPEPKKSSLENSVFLDSSCSFLEKADDRLPEPEKLETSDQVFEEIICEDDHPVFDLTTDIFSEDELIDNIEAKSDSIKTPAADRNHVPALSSGTNPSRTNSLSASALASGESGSASKLSSLIFSFVNTKIPTSVEKSTKENDEDDDDLPLFDLGLDFDPIPPTPIHGKPRSLIAKSTHSTPISTQLRATSESHQRIQHKSPIVRDENFFSDSGEEDNLGGFRLVLPSLNVIQSQSTPFSKKKKPSEDLFSSSPSTNAPILLENEDDFSPSSVASHGFDLKFDDLLADDDLDGCDVPVQPKNLETTRSQEKQGISTETENKCDSSDDSFLVLKTRKKRVRLKSPSPQKKSTSFTEPIEIMDDDDDDSFCIRKRKKSVVLKSPIISSQNEGQESDQRSKRSLSPKPLHKRINFMLDESNSQDDFQEADQSFWKRPSVNKTKSRENGKLRQKSRHHPKRDEHSDVRNFLDEEAELSGSDDGHSDEEIEEDDHYEQSFINDFSQADRTQHMVDMRAVYLQSVVSPVVKHHGYKMKYDKVNVSDVYSCRPDSDDDYEHDSFCVESEEESYLTENTAIEDSLLERAPPKSKNKDIGNKNKKKRVIRPESSSEEEEIFQDQNKNPPVNVSDSDKRLQRVEVDLTIKENEQTSKAGSSSAVVTETVDCDDSEPLVVYADSREISGAQDIISDLRIQHKVNVVVTKLEACDYVVSLRTAVERKVMSDFANGANHKKLVQRLQEMCEYFERPCLIVEKNPQKGQDKKNVPRPMPQTKYLETLLSQLSLSPIRLLFSDSKLETCALLASLCFQEKAKGMAIYRNQTLSDPEQQKMKFFSSLPKVNHALALNLCKNYKTIKSFLQSSVSLIVTRSKMSSERALYLHRFVRQQYR